jgi:hypothetical protein
MLADHWRPLLRDLDAGLPVIVNHGWQGREPDSGPFVVDPDEALVEVEPIFADAAATVRVVVDCRRPDGPRPRATRSARSTPALGRSSPWWAIPL